MKKMFTEFKNFISRGNVLDMAIGVIVAGAFGKITTALVNELLMPFIGWVFGGTDATAVLNVTLKAAELDAEGNVITPATVLGFGNFVNTIIDFVIIAFVCFMIVRAFNKARELAEKRKKEAEAAAAAAAAEAAAAEAPAEPEPTKEELLLAEIRDLLKEQKKG